MEIYSLANFKSFLLRASDNFVLSPFAIPPSIYIITLTIENMVTHKPYCSVLRYFNRKGIVKKAIPMFKILNKTPKETFFF